MGGRRLVAAIAAVIAFGAHATSVSEASATRLYLLHADSGFNYWSPDPAQPEASALAFTRRCAEYTGTVCGTASATPLGYASLVPFLPGGQTDGALSWSPSAPLRFRFAMDVLSDVPYTVHGFAFGGSLAQESPAATQTAPGVWEGAIFGPGTVAPGATLLFGIVVRQPGPVRSRLQIDIRAAGASWFELTAAASIASVSDLEAASTYRPNPTNLVTAERSLRFNDTDWESRSFSGDLSAAHEFTVTLGRRAAIVMAWIESVSEPFAYGVAGGDPDARRPTETGLVRLRKGTTELSFARYSASALDVSAGNLTVRVEPQSNDASHPYTAHVAVIYGDRTLEAFRWRFEVPALLVRSPVLQAYQGPLQQIPSSREVTTFLVAVSVSDASSPSPNQWAIGFDVPGVYAPEAGMSGTRSPLRVVARGQRLSRITPTPAYNAIMASAWDTVFEGEVRYAYTAP